MIAMVFILVYLFDPDSSDSVAEECGVLKPYSGGTSFPEGGSRNQVSINHMFHNQH